MWNINYWVLPSLPFSFRTSITLLSAISVFMSFAWMAFSRRGCCLVVFVIFLFILNDWYNRVNFEISSHTLFCFSPISVKSHFKQHSPALKTSVPASILVATSILYKGNLGAAVALPWATQKILMEMRCTSHKAIPHKTTSKQNLQKTSKGREIHCRSDLAIFQFITVWLSLLNEWPPPRQRWHCLPSFCT